MLVLLVKKGRAKLRLLWGDCVGGIVSTVSLALAVMLDWILTLMFSLKVAARFMMAVVGGKGSRSLVHEYALKGPLTSSKESIASEWSRH